MAQLVRAPPCHGGGRGFESLLGRQQKCCDNFISHGIIAQLGEHLPYKQGVTGSSPVGPIIADVAQLAEQLICNQQVIGSSPIVGFCLMYSHNGWVPERPKGADCKSVSNAFEGSNPSPSILLLKTGKNQLNTIAGWSSLEARRAHNPKVVGSNPAPATHAQIAQSVEQGTENPCVAGSIPALGISNGTGKVLFGESRWEGRKTGLTIFIYKK